MGGFDTCTLAVNTAKLLPMFWAYRMNLGIVGTYLRIMIGECAEPVGLLRLFRQEKEVLRQSHRPIKPLRSADRICVDNKLRVALEGDDA